MSSDSNDYTYPGAIRFVPAATPMTGPERMQAEIDSLAQRVRDLEKIVHRLLNPEGEGDL